MDRRTIAGIVALVVALAAAHAAHAQRTMSLGEASARNNTDFSPVHLGETVTVAGQVSIRALRILEYVHLPIQAKDEGLILEGTPGQMESFASGDWVEATGRIARRGGMPVLVVNRIAATAGGARPIAIDLPVDKLNSFEYIGRRVRTEARVTETGENAGGYYVRLEGGGGLKVFLPDGVAKTLPEARAGDTVVVTGVSYQYCLSPPFNRHFELLISDAAAVQVSSFGWLLRLLDFRRFTLLVLVAGAVWWWRERLASRHRDLIRKLNWLGEEVLESPSAADIAGRLEAELPKALRVDAVRLYLFDRGANALSPVMAEGPRPDGERKVETAPVNAAAGVINTGLAACFQNRNLLDLPDTRKSPFEPTIHELEWLPRSLLFIPMLAQSEAVGVLLLETNRKKRQLSGDEKAVAQHLANQTAVAVKLLQQKSFREQLSRSEKLAAVGRLISGVVNDLQTPLASILSMAEASIERQHGQTGNHELLVIGSEARRASAIVARLVSFAQTEQVEAAPVDLNQLLWSLIRFRDREWRASGIQLRGSLNQEQLFVMGSQGQLEQTFLTLIVQAEQTQEDVVEKWIKLRADVLGRRVFVEVSFASAGGGARRGTAGPVDAASDVGLEVCRTIVSGHGGELRVVRGERESSFEIEIPWLSVDHAVERAVAADARDSSRQWTAMVLEPEQWVERQIVEMLTERGYRVVPVASADEGLDLISRMRFDLVICSTRIPGLNWVEFFDRIRGRVTAFLLLAESFSHDLSMHFRGAGRFALLKPIEKNQFERTFEAIEARLMQLEARANGVPNPERILRRSQMNLE